MLPSLRVTSPPTHTPTSKFNASQSSCQQVAQGVKAHLCSQWGLGTKMDQNMPSPSNWTLWDRQSQDQYRAVVCMSHPWKKCHHLPSGTGLGGGCPWVGEHPLVFSANLTVRVKITPAASFSKIKGDAIENVCRCIQTQMGTSVFNCKWVRTEQMRFPLYLGSKNYRENVPEAETNQPPQHTHTLTHMYLLLGMVILVTEKEGVVFEQTKASGRSLHKINEESITCQFTWPGDTGYRLSALRSRGKGSSHPICIMFYPRILNIDWEGKVDLHRSDLGPGPAPREEYSCHTRGGSWIG